MNEQLKQFSLEQLKAMAYDELARLETAQTNLRILNEEIRARGDVKKAVKSPKPEPVGLSEPPVQAE